MIRYKEIAFVAYPVTDVARARKAKCEESGPLVIGFDPAWMGVDRSSMARRRGRRLISVESKCSIEHNGEANMPITGQTRVGCATSDVFLIK